MLVKLVNEIKGFGDSAEKPKGLGGLFWNAKKAVSDMQTKYDKVEVNVDAIASSLEGYQVQLLKDISLFNHLYDMNTEYFKELTMYILAGEKRLAEVRRTTLEELKARAAQSGDAMTPSAPTTWQPTATGSRKSCTTSSSPVRWRCRWPRRSAFCRTTTACW